MAVSVDVLTRLAHGLRAVLQGPDHVLPGQRLRLRLTPAPSELRVSGLLTGTTHSLSLSKEVLFRTPTAVPPPLSGQLGSDFGDLTRGLPVTTPSTSGVTQLTGVTGGRMEQREDEQAVAAQVPVRVEVKWSITTEFGGEANGFAAPEGLATPELSLMFTRTALLTRNVLGEEQESALVTMLARASVRLSVEETQTDWITLAPVPVTVVGTPYLSLVLGALREASEIVTDQVGPVLPGRPVLLRLRRYPVSLPLLEGLPYETDIQWEPQEAEAALERGTHFEAPEGLRSAEATLVFAWRGALNPTSPAPRDVRIHARMRLRAGELTTEWLEVSPRALPVLTAEMLNLQVLRQGSGPVVPGRPIRLRVSSPRVPLFAPLEAGPAQAEISWSVTHGGSAEPVPGVEAPSGLHQPELSLTFPWTHGAPSAPAPLPVAVHADVTLVAAGKRHALPRVTLPLAVTTVGMLGLQLVRDGAGPVLPGQAVSLKVVSPLLPLAAGPSANPVPAEVSWSVTRAGTEEPVTDFDAPLGLKLPEATFLFRWRNGPGGSTAPLRFDVHALVRLPGAEPLRLTCPLTVATLSALELQAVASEEGLVVPGRKVRVQLLSPLLPLEPAAPAPATVRWSLHRAGTEEPVPGVQVPHGPRSPELTLVFPLLHSPDGTPSPLPVEVRGRVRLAPVGGEGDEFTPAPVLLNLLTAEMLDMGVERSEAGPLRAGQSLTLRVRPPSLPPEALQALQALGGPEQTARLLRLRWTVTDGQGAPVSDFRADATGSGQVTFLFAPPVVAAEATPSPAPVQRWVRFTVAVSLGSGVCETDLPPVRVDLLPASLPTLLALFTRTDFASSPEHPGAALVAVPSGSALATPAQALARLETLRAELSPLAAFPPFASLLPELELVAAALRQQTSLAFHSGDDAKDLSSIPLPRGGDSKATADDALCSLLLLSASRGAACYRAPDLTGEEYPVPAAPSLVRLIPDLGDWKKTVSSFRFQ